LPDASSSSSTRRARSAASPADSPLPAAR
jgi:hypothetical protein